MIGLGHDLHDRVCTRCGATDIDSRHYNCYLDCELDLRALTPEELGVARQLLRVPNPWPVPLTAQYVISLFLTLCGGGTELVPQAVVLWLLVHQNRGYADRDGMKAFWQVNCDLDPESL